MYLLISTRLLLPPAAWGHLHNPIVCGRVETGPGCMPGRPHPIPTPHVGPKSETDPTEPLVRRKQLAWSRGACQDPRGHAESILPATARRWLGPGCFFTERFNFHLEGFGGSAVLRATPALGEVVAGADSPEGITPCQQGKCRCRNAPGVRTEAVPAALPTCPGVPAA